MARGVHSPKLKQEAIRLRVEDRLSYNEINKKLNVSKSTLSNWLKDKPLALEERLTKKRKRPYKDRGVESKWHKIAKKKPLDRNQKGRLAEAAVLFRLVLEGFAVFGSPFDGEKADWIACVPDSNKTHKIQVRLTKHTKGLPCITLNCVRNNKESRLKQEDFDFIVGYNLYNDTAYVFSYDEIKHLKTSVAIQKKAAEAWHKML